MKIIALLLMLIMAGINAKTVKPVQAAPITYWEPAPVYQGTEPEREMLNGYVVLERDGDDVCLLVDGQPVWVTLIDEDDCDCDASVDWDEFDKVLEEIDPLPGSDTWEVPPIPEPPMP